MLIFPWDNWSMGRKASGLTSFSRPPCLTSSAMPTIATVLKSYAVCPSDIGIESLALYLPDANRDIVEDLRSRRSFWHRQSLCRRPNRNVIFAYLRGTRAQ